MHSNIIQKTSLTYKIWRCIDSKSKKELGEVFFVIFLVSLLEVLSVSSTIPLFSILTNSNSNQETLYYESIFGDLRIIPTHATQFYFCIVFILIALLAGAMRLILIKKSTKISFDIGNYLSNIAYHNFLYQPYSAHCNQNSSKILSILTNKIDHVIGYINQVLNLASSFFTSLFILGAMIIFAPEPTIIAFSALSFSYTIFIIINKNKVSLNGQIIAKESSKIIKIVNEGIGAIRHILLENSQKIYCNIFNDSTLKLRKAQSQNQFIAASPRIYIEAVSAISIGLIVYFFSSNKSASITFIPLLAMFAYASQRLIPAIQQIYSATTAIRASQDSIVEIFNLIEDFHIKDNRISKGIAYKSYFKKNIQLENISFSYKLKSYFSLKNISLSLEKGKITGITGPSGSGKSTLIDIILGLLQPSSGVIKIDGKVLGSSVLLDFQSKISHVPQSIFLTDSSVAENIAFGIPKSKINKNLLIDCSKRAQLYELIKKLPSGFDTFVGERGIKLSGGQKQRIAIARALYKKSEFIIFDEATSALDILSEENIMKTIYKLKNDITILIIAHRLSTLRKCNKIYELKKGRISRVLNYKNLVKSI